MVLKVRPVCVPEVALESRVPARTRHHVETVARHLRVLTVTTRIGAVISIFFGVQGLIVGQDVLWVTVVNLISGALFLLIPLLYKYGELVAPLVFHFVAYTSITVVCWHLGTGSGLLLYYLLAATLMVMILGVDHLVLASMLAALGAATVITLEFLVPYNTGVQPDWAMKSGFILTVISGFAMAIAVVWYALRETRRAREAMEAEYERSESLLANILPATIAAAAQGPIAQHHRRQIRRRLRSCSPTSPATPNAPATPRQAISSASSTALYTDLDALVDQHGLEKVKTSGDSYMVVSGVPRAARDHLEALACLALDMADAVADLKDPQGREVPLRMGIAAGPVVAGVVGARKFFYDVWGDAVNVAARMETTDVEGRIQVPQNVYERLNHAFLLEKRGEVDVKGKGLMHTWYLVGRRNDEAVRQAVEQGAPAGSV